MDTVVPIMQEDLIKLISQLRAIFDKSVRHSGSDGIICPFCFRVVVEITFVDGELSFNNIEHKSDCVMFVVEEFEKVYSPDVFIDMEHFKGLFRR